MRRGKPLSDIRRRVLSEAGRRRWAALSPEERRRRTAFSKACYQLAYPDRATWSERWIADAMSGAPRQ